MNRQRLLAQTVGGRLVDHLPDSFEELASPSILAA
jgi:hypothetical protein